MRSNLRNIIASAVTSAVVALGIGVGIGHLATASASGNPVSASGETFRQLPQVRVADTRPAPNNIGGVVGPIVNGQTFSVQTGLVPATSAVVVIGLFQATGATSVAVGPSNDQIIPASRGPVAFAASGSATYVTTTVALGPDGAFKIRVGGANTHISVDVIGVHGWGFGANTPYINFNHPTGQTCGFGIARTTVNVPAGVIPTGGDPFHMPFPNVATSGLYNATGPAYAGFPAAVPAPTDPLPVGCNQWRFATYQGGDGTTVGPLISTTPQHQVISGGPIYVTWIAAP